MAGLAGDQWRITPEERAKHDAQFFQLKPVNGFVTGVQAKNFFLQSGLPSPVLGAIWGLADLTADGKMDKLEFSIAMHLIKKKLEGFELPKTLPAVMKAAPAPGGFNMMQPAGFAAPNIGAPAVMPVAVSMGGSFGMPNPTVSAASIGGVQPMIPTSASFSMSNGMGKQSASFPTATTTSFPQPAQPNLNRVPTAVTGGEWAIPQPSKLKYSQMFNMHDRMRKGHLTGMEVRAILTQTGILHTTLAQIWNLSDIDNDGKLTCDEFTVCMHLVDLAKMGQPLPAKLPPELIPPSYRRGKAGGMVAAAPVPAAVQPPATTSAVQPPTDAFGDLLGGMGMGFGASTMPVQQHEEAEPLQEHTPATFEDRRKANFDKGQAELERRRQQLLEEQKRMEEERLAKEREAAEKREKLRQEQERKKQLEMERQLAKQREIEQKREEERRKALEQREAARRELERQRQMEWERQRKEQLIAERQREQNQVEAMQADFGKLKLDLEALDNKKKDMSDKITRARTDVSDFTASIESMRVARDTKLSDIEHYQQEIQSLEQKLARLHQDKQNFQTRAQIQANSVGDTYNTVMHSYESKKINIEKLKEQVAQMEKDTEAKLSVIDQNNSQLNELNNKLNDLQSQNNKLYQQMQQKQREWKDGIAGGSLPGLAQNDDKKPKENGLFSGFDTFGSSQSTKKDTVTTNDVWGSGSQSSATNKKDVWSGTFSQADTFGSSSISWGAPDATTSTTGAATNTSDATSFEAQQNNLFNSTQATTTSTSRGASGLDSLLSWGSSTSSAPVKETNTSNLLGGLASLDWSKVSGKSAAPALPVASEWKPSASSKKHKALYQFDGNRPDEISLKPGDIVWVKADQSKSEPGWYEGEMNGKTGFFPKDYVKEEEEQLQQDTSAFPAASSQNSSSAFAAFSTSEATATSVSGGLLTTASQSLFTAVASAPSPTPGQGKTAPDGLQVQALYPWRAKKDNHLTFDKGDIIIVKEQQDMWWSGELGGKEYIFMKIIGWFPKSYVKVLGNQSVTEEKTEADTSLEHVVPQQDHTATSQPQAAAETTDTSDQNEYYVAMYNYQSSEPGDLTFNQGEVIMVSKKEEDWFTGTLNGRSGIFPANYVKKMETQAATLTQKTSPPSTLGGDLLTVPGTRAETGSGASSPTSPLQPGQKLNKKPEIASVIAPYQATGQEQLSLQPGQLIQVRKKSPSGWWEGELQARGQKRKIGWFPANYVKLLGTGSARSTPDSQAQRTSLTASPSKSLSPTPQPGDDGSRSATPALPHPTSAPALEQVVAMYAYQAQHEDELNFHKGSVINVLNKDDANWWKGECNNATGMFPSNYVQPLAAMAETPDTPSAVSWSTDPAVIASTSSTEKKRQHHIHELIKTEESYMKDLSVVIEVFQKPMRTILTEEEMDKIFVNWNEIIICNTKLLKGLRVRRKVTGEGQVLIMVGDILCENLPHMTPYIRFCSVQVKAAGFLQNKIENDNRFSSLHKKCMMDRRVTGLPLSTFLLKPMQRITKYPLIVSKILDYTPASHPDHAYLEEALAKASEVCSQVNEGVHQTDNTDKLEWIQSHVQCDGLPEKLIFNSVTNCLGGRRYLYSGTLYKTKSGKELVGFLFNDFLLLTVPQKSLGNAACVFSFDIKANTTFKMYRNPIFLNEIMTPIKAPTEEGENQVFHLSHVDKIYSLKAISCPERDTWVKKIEAAAKVYLETERKKREKAHTARNELRSASIGRLLVVVVEGAELHTSDKDALSLVGVGQLNIVVEDGINLIAADLNEGGRAVIGRILVMIMEGLNLQPGGEGKSDPYCEVSMGPQEHKTKVIQNTLNPKWNASMQFTIRDLQQDVLCITVFDRDLFTPNDFLGRTEVRIKDIYRESKEKKGPITKRLLLHEVDSGEVVVKLDLQLFEPT